MLNIRPIFSLPLLLAIIINNCISQDDWDCISSCKCLWISGKKTAECKSQNFSGIPDFLSKEIQHLDLTGNNITYLPERTFSLIKLDNLQKLVLRNCNIRVIHSEAFNGLRIVIEIDLTGNSIAQLYRGTFDQTERLRVLLLNRNRLQKLENDLFRNLAFLQKIELSDNDLVQIGQYTFRNLTGLQILTLDGNKLSSLSMNGFDRLSRLSSLELRKNPWNCDCQLKPFRDWAIQHNLYRRPTSCKNPVILMDRMWDEIPSDNFACAPKIELVGALQHGDTNTGSAQLWCHATAIPKPQITWIHHQRVLTNDTKRHASDRTYILYQNDEWANLSIPDTLYSDKGEYVCIAKNFGGSMEKNVSLLVLGEATNTRYNTIGIPLGISSGIAALIFLLIALALWLYYSHRSKICHDETKPESASLDHHGLGEQDKSLITLVNPVVKPPRRYEASSVTTYTERAELNRTLLDSASVFVDGVGTVMGVLPNGFHDNEYGLTTPNLDCVIGGSDKVNNCIITSFSSAHGNYTISSLSTGTQNVTTCRQHTPDLLAFSRCGSSPTSQTSTAPDYSRVSIQRPFFDSPLSSFSMLGKTGSIISAYRPIRFQTLPHPARANSVTPCSLAYHYSSLSKNGYGTTPRRPRMSSWGSSPPNSYFEREIPEPIYDNLGVRSTADGSSILSLNKSLEPGLSVLGCSLPKTYTSTCFSSANARNGLLLPPASRSSSLIAQQHNRSAPEGAVERPRRFAEEQKQQQRKEIKEEGRARSPTTMKQLSRKVPPRPPPKPKKKSINGPLYEDEDEDGTEV